MVTRQSVSPSFPPEEPPLELLEPFERWNVRLMGLLERHAVPVTEWWLRTVGNFWMYGVSSRMMTGYGYERLASVRPDAPILLVCNHRTYFDLYLLAVLLERFTHLHQPVFCPVRADFFYEHPVGTLLNLLVGGGRMYPPVFRQAHKAAFNQWSMAHLAEMLRRGDVLVGYHPEGKRNLGDPYTPLPARHGVGQLVMETWPVVIPVFFNGLTNNFLSDTKKNFLRQKRVIAVFGEPVDLGPFRGLPPGWASQKRIAEHLIGIIYNELGAEERRIRASLPPLGD